MNRPLVGILMGSDSDLPVMEKAAEVLTQLEIPWEMDISSAHRMPEKTAEYARTARQRGIEVLICGAGMAAHLAGVVASHTTLPVIGVPLNPVHWPVLMPFMPPCRCRPVFRWQRWQLTEARTPLSGASILSIKYTGLADKLEQFRAATRQELEGKSLDLQSRLQKS